MQIIKSFLSNTHAATSIEYGIIAAGVALVIVASVNSVGIRLQTLFDNLGAAGPTGAPM